MKEWKVLFIGVGSIAKRHIKNIVTVIMQRSEKIQIDVFRSGNRNSLDSDIKSFVSLVYYEYNKVPYDYDIVFVTNPTQFHIDTIKTFHKKGKHFFIEKPLCPTWQIKQHIIYPEKDSIYYIAAPLRYNPVIKYIKENIFLENVISARCISSSYLPEWRPGKDYRDTYSAHKDMGGGVSIDLIHEWDYITYIFGFPEIVKYIHGKKSKLEIDSDDFAIYIAEYRKQIVEIHLDYFGRKPIREIMLFMEDDTVVGDLVKNEIYFLKKDKKIVFDETRDDYQKRELNYFFDLVCGKETNNNDIIHALSVLKLTQGEL